MNIALTISKYLCGIFAVLYLAGAVVLHSWYYLGVGIASILGVVLSIDVERAFRKSH